MTTKGAAAGTTQGGPTFVDVDDMGESSNENENADLEALDKGPCSCCTCHFEMPQMYPWWSIPPLFLFKPKQAWKHKTLILANLILVGLLVYYFILYPFTDYNSTAVTDLLWLAGVAVILMTIFNINHSIRLIKGIKVLAKRAQRSIDIKREMTRTINKLGKGEKDFKKQLVGLHDKIKETKYTVRTLAQRNTQGYKEVVMIEEIFENALKEQTNFAESRVRLMEQVTDHMGHLEDVEDIVESLNAQNNSIKDEAEHLNQTLDKLQGTVFVLSQALGDMEKLRFEVEEKDAGERDDMENLIHRLERDRERLRDLTAVMEASMARTIVNETMAQAGESGIDRESWTAMVERYPAGAYRAHEKLGDKATFDANRQEGRQKIMDKKLQRRKRPGVNAEGAKEYIDMLRDKIQELSEKRMGLEKLKPPESAT